MRTLYLNTVSSNTAEILVRIPTGYNGQGIILLLNKHHQYSTPGLSKLRCLRLFKREPLDSIEDRSLSSDGFPYNGHFPGQSLQYSAGEPYLERHGMNRTLVFV